jgi:dGTPase
MNEMNTELRQFLMQYFYKHPRVTIMNKQAEVIMRELYPYYLNSPELLKASLPHIFDITPLPRVAADYLAGMTDNFAEEEYKKIARSLSLSK